MSNEKKQQTPQEQYNGARGAWMFFVLATAIYLVLGMAGAKWQFPFLSEIVRLVAGLGEGVLFDGLGLAVTAGFAYLWYLSEKKYAVMTVCFGIYLADSVLALTALLGGRLDTMVTLFAVVRLLLMWSMLMGVKAGRLLKKAEEEPMVILADSTAEEDAPAAENREN